MSNIHHAAATSKADKPGTESVVDGESKQEPIAPMDGYINATSVQVLPSIVIENPPSPPKTRYEFRERIADGGMGIVWRGYDYILFREVALKTVHDRYETDPQVMQRFIREAEISAQLQHPGIVPVYDLGQFEENRKHYLAMKLVKGRTLGEILQERTDARQDLARFLQIFEQVCLTLAYAHSKQVIHRDLKPNNIMVGAFGEVYVMDWGLAKLIAPGTSSQGGIDAIPASVIEVDPNIPSDATKVGSMLGTPAYMPPEQAQGQVDLLDQRADVFALGAILCHILTGQPPYIGNAADVRRLAMMGHVQETWERLDRSEQDPELILLTKRCLSPRMEDRPSEANRVAQILTAYRINAEERFRQAEIERAAAEARAEAENLARTAAEAQTQAEARERLIAQEKAQEERKRRQTQLLLMLTSLAAIIVISLGAIWYQQKQAERQQQLEWDMVRGMERAQTLLEQARIAPIDQPDDRAEAEQLWQETMTTIQDLEKKEQEQSFSEITHQRIQELVRTIQTEAQTTSKNCRMLTQLEQARELILNIQEVDHQKSRRVYEIVLGVTSAIPAYAVAFQEYGIDLTTTSISEAAEKIRGSAIRSRLIQALDEIAYLDFKYANNKSLEIAEMSDEDILRKSIRKAILKSNLKELQELTKQQPPTHLGVGLVLLVSDLLRVTLEFDLALELMKKAASEFRQDHLIQDILGLHLMYGTIPRYEEASIQFASVCALKSNMAIGWNNLADCLFVQGYLEKSLVYYEEAIQREPNNPVLQSRYVLALGLSGQLPKASEYLSKKLAILPNSPSLRGVQADLLAYKGQIEAAIEHYKNNLQENPKWYLTNISLCDVLSPRGEFDRVEQTVNNLKDLYPEIGDVYLLEGNMRLHQAKYQEALECYDKALKRTLWSISARQGRIQVLLGLNRNNQALQEAEELTKSLPHSYRACYIHGEVLEIQKKYVEAITIYQQGIRLNRFEIDNYRGLARVFSQQEKYQDSIHIIQKAIEINPLLPDLHSLHGEYLSYIGNKEESAKAFERAAKLAPQSHYNFNQQGNTHFNNFQYSEAIVCYKKAIELDSKSYIYHTNLALAYESNNQIQEAITQATKSIELNPVQAVAHRIIILGFRKLQKNQNAKLQGEIALKYVQNDASIHNAIGLVLEDMGQKNEAVLHFQKAIELNPNQSVYRSNLGLLYQTIRKYDDAIEQFKYAVKLDSQSADNFNQLGNSYYYAEKYSQAEDAYRQAIQLNPNSSVYYFNLSGALMYQAGKINEALSVCQQAIDKEPKNLDNWVRLAEIYQKLKLYDDMLSAANKAIRLNFNSIPAQLALAHALSGQKKYSQAASIFLLVLDREPFANQVRIELAICYLELNQPFNAILEIKKILSNDPKFFAAQSRYSQALVQLGRTEEAVIAARNAIELSPNDSRVHFRLGEALLRNGDFNESVQSLLYAQRLRDPKIEYGTPIAYDERLREAQECLRLDHELAILATGKVQSNDPMYLLQMAQFAGNKKRDFALAVKLYQTAFLQDSTKELEKQHSVIAAHMAVLAATTTKKTNLEDRQALRQQAMNWLKQHPTNDTFLDDPRFAGVRHPLAVAMMPEKERKEWIHYWKR